MEAFKPRYFISEIGAKLSRSQIYNIAVKHLNKTYQISYSGMRNLESIIQVNFSWETEEIQMFVSTNNLCEFIDPRLQGLVFEDLSEELQSILIQVLGESLKDIFAQFQQTLIFKSGNIFKNDSSIACLNISDETRSIIEIGLANNKSNGTFLDAITRTLPKQQTLNLPLNFCFSKGIGGIRLSINEFQTLRLGDILLNQWQKDLVHFSYQYFAFLGKKENNNIAILKRLMNEKEDLPAGIIPEETPLNNPEDVAVEATPEEPILTEPEKTVSVENLPVNVIFQAGQQTLTLQQLQQLQEGYVFELEPNADEMITIIANGQSIGRGRWVQVEDHTGVQITQLIVE